MWKRFLFAKKSKATRTKQTTDNVQSQRTIDTECSLTELGPDHDTVRFDASSDKIHIYPAATSLCDKNELFYSNADYEVFQSERNNFVNDAIERKDAHIQSLEILFKNEHDQSTIEPYILASLAHSSLRGYEYAFSKSLQEQRQATIQSVLELQQTTQDADLLRSASRVLSSASRRFAFQLANGDAQVARGVL